MRWLVIAALIAVYVVVTYVAVYRSMKKSPGPAGLGMLLVPFAPLILPLAIAMVIAWPFKKLWKAIKG